MDNKIRILLVDDHPFFRQGVTFFLDSVAEFELVGDCSSGEEAIELVASQQIDIILMDLQMSGMDGIETTREILKYSPTIRILILTSFGSGEKITEALNAGAAGYCLKDAPPQELATAVKAVAAGGTYLGRGISLSTVTHNRQTVEDNHNTNNQTCQQAINSLTQRELDVLKLLTQGLANKEIAEQLFVSEKTVKTHVANILHKLGVKTRTQAALLANKHNPTSF
ncbi:response regulator [Desulfuribacillus alkaliarsenatis]|uniref:DNA-binding response regulator n=1 Tax=Desulfuribacillus alkaliarsenatis TaxID=766136 RepID=A0A1E5G2Z1_9FIRM|nr:response regulator transcription factor [Desulfuribacillus alkaliarsenatis]OEF97437.1 hypothetical protein BHF68_04300 [Desulfuribacillus alkaliarsenatis]